MSHYTRKSIPAAKFESGGHSSFGDMTSQNVRQKKGTSHQIRRFTPGKRVQLLTYDFYVQNRSSRPKTIRHVNFSNFQAEENFFIFTIFRTSQ